MYKFFNSVKNYVAAHYGNHPGKMLVHTGVIGWTLSAMAQVCAIVFNDKIPKDVKSYMIPQEIADAGVNILSFYLITRSCQSLTRALVSSGKLLPKAVREHLVSNKLYPSANKAFDVLTHGNLTPELKNTYDRFYKGADVIGTTIGTILSCNIITPIVRNQIAASRQKEVISKRQNRVLADANYMFRPSMQSFSQNAGNLKI